MNTEIKNKWLEALRSGKYQQGTGALKRSDECFCCLGVLLDTIDSNGWELLEDDNDIMRWRSGDVTQSGWLDNIMCEKIDLDGKLMASLASDNDHGRSFAYIANRIESEA